MWGGRPGRTLDPVLPPQRIGDGNGRVHQPRDRPPAGAGPCPGGDAHAPRQRPPARGAAAPGAREPAAAPRPAHRRPAVVAMATTSENVVARLASAAAAGDERAWAALLQRLDPLVRGVVRGYR